MRNRAVICWAAVLAFACGDVITPPVSFTGSYRLQTVNGERSYKIPGTAAEIVELRLWLDDDDSLAGRITLAPVGDNCVDEGIISFETIEIPVDCWLGLTYVLEREKPGVGSQPDS